MEIKFTSEFGELDLTNAKISIEENNSKVSDTMFTKYTLPFETYATQDFLQKYGDYVSYETANLKNKISGFLQLEGKVHNAVLYIQSIEGYKVTAQLDFGFEELPNFDKKLSELPLEKFNVDDIHIYAKQICAKKYPATNFNFPRIYTDKYSPDSEQWQTFDGYYNDLKPDGTEMRRNYLDNDLNIFNVNIIHPCPHILYLLKTGFSDAGFELEGDILTDENLQQKWVFSGTEYFSLQGQNQVAIDVKYNDYVEKVQVKTGLDFFDFVNYRKYSEAIEIEKAGEYHFIGEFVLRCYKKSMFYGISVMDAYFRIYLNNQLVYEKIKQAGNIISMTTFPIDIEFNVLSDASVIRFESYLYENKIFEPATDTVINGNLTGFPIDSESEDSQYVLNLNEVDLKRAVPDITFGDLVNVIKNWFNYDIEIVDKTIFMNRIGKNEVSGVEDFRFLESPTPKRNLLNKKSFLIKFTDLDGDNKKDSMFYDFEGQKLNGTGNEETNTIEINGYAMQLKLPLPGGYNTAFVMKDTTDVVALVEYSGLQFGQNNAVYLPGCDFPELFYNNWLKWLRQRISGQEYNWKFFCTVEQISGFSIKDYIFCYNNIHIIKSMTKEKISDNIYDVEITTETVV
ncbi:MAG: hypothetical protein LBE36_06265 [Flavobacteriaceae bacterium]|jgi:hypothetical protein|nr:hypothetical protein [Flavobacteriaceae bacterium]